MVRVDVDHRDAAVLGPQARGSDRGVVQVARPAVGAARDVVARRAAAGVRGRGAREHEVGRRQRGVGGRARRLPRARADQRHRVEGEVAGPRPRCGRNRAASRSARDAGKRTGRRDPGPGRPAGLPPPTPPTRPRGSRGARRRGRRAPARRRAARPRRTAHPRSRARRGSRRRAPAPPRRGRRSPIQTSPPGSCSRWLSLQTTGRPSIARAYRGSRVRPVSTPREHGIRIGDLEPGPANAITDVEGVRVGHVTVVRDEPDPPEGRGVARTGVTVVAPPSLPVAGGRGRPERRGRDDGLPPGVASGACSRRPST